MTKYIIIDRLISRHVWNGFNTLCNHHSHSHSVQPPFSLPLHPTTILTSPPSHHRHSPSVPPPFSLPLRPTTILTPPPSHHPSHSPSVPPPLSLHLRPTTTLTPPLSHHHSHSHSVPPPFSLPLRPTTTLTPPPPTTILTPPPSHHHSHSPPIMSHQPLLFLLSSAAVCTHNSASASILSHTNPPSHCLPKLLTNNFFMN